MLHHPLFFSFLFFSFLSRERALAPLSSSLSLFPPHLRSPRTHARCTRSRCVTRVLGQEAAQESEQGGAAGDGSGKSKEEDSGGHSAAAAGDDRRGVAGRREDTGAYFFGEILFLEGCIVAARAKRENESGGWG